MQSAAADATPADSDIVRLARLPRAERRRVIGKLTPAVAAKLRYDWKLRARPDQLAPEGDWTWWWVISGRGWGKTRTGAEFVRARIDSYGRWALVAPTAADARDVMVEGESGLLNIGSPDERPNYEPSKRRLTWPNGAQATLYSAEEPDRLRGPQHEAAWADEVATWKFPETWDMLQFGLRLGSRPVGIATTTPRPVRTVRDALADPSTVVTRGTTYDNADNLAEPFLRQIVTRYEGTRLGRQELHGELLEDYPGAFWTRASIEDHRVREAPELGRIVVAVDPATTSGEDSDETAVCVAARGTDGEFYVLGEAGYRLSPHGWATQVFDHYDRFSADRIIAERNNGGEMVEATLRQVRRNAPVKTIHASRGKTVRAEPIAALYEQGRVHHVGTHPDLEDQMCRFPVASDLDDRVDALVYALTELATVGVPADGSGPEPVPMREQVRASRWR